MGSNNYLSCVLIKEEYLLQVGFKRLKQLVAEQGEKINKKHLIWIPDSWYDGHFIKAKWQEETGEVFIVVFIGPNKCELVSSPRY